ncbi:MFS transporter [Nocardioides sp. C4-1]|uniref:MFS transporter n=1 Tax=Nocardioides sp. C4-1 TaxID=3151851 RepID=UPI003267944D
MFSSYSRILAHPGAALFSGTALVARLPIAMLGLGIVLLVEDATGSYGLAGAVSGAGLLANAACAVLQARLIDRFGQSRVLPVAISLWGVWLAALMSSVEAGWALWTTYVFAVLAGVCMPSVGSCVRARWAHVLPEDRDRQTAFALEAVADEAVFIAGPILATVLATAIHPVVGLTTALTTGVLGTLAFAAQRATEPPPHPAVVEPTDRARMPWATVLPLSVASLALGTLFGAAEVTTVAFADERGAKAVSGVLLALWAAGSLVAGVLTGMVVWQRPVLWRLRVGAAAMTVVMVPLTFVEPLWLMGVVLLGAGLAIAPTLIAVMTLTEQVVPPSRLTEGMAFVHTGIVAGVAPGAAAAGLVVDGAGASAAYLVPVAGGLLALAATAAVRSGAVPTRSPRDLATT